MQPQLDYTVREVAIGLRSRLIIWLMRCLLRPWLARIVTGKSASLIGAQLLTAAQALPRGLPLQPRYELLGAQQPVPGHVFGELGEPGGSVLLWLHGGAFLLPAAPSAHLATLSRLCQRLGVACFVPDYRLAPHARFPAGLDDCERAYRLLLELGYAPGRIVLGGDSAGGNLLFGLLQRIRAAGLPMPAAAVALSPAAELSRAHAPPSRLRNRKRDALLSVKDLSAIRESYVGAADASDPQVSPVYADFQGFPPLLLLASDAEILCDDAVLLAARARRAGVEVRLDIWPVLPHAFPLFAASLREARAALDDIAAFLQDKLAAPRRAA
ncbi:Acetyl esterase/lipase [Solimonas aquatica]|uniref:Acetyl esterase/lipase n=1 Tax=Solimonas aquatica TaxID=489703 RepID=A0A1H9J7W2_9GAMM|nr:alpha/beta hydrolase [Solimonas aquatica]SEQ82974.1 Acetyl esterase/lipase [Solimonas aquatica]